jgi:hypothetical protein
MKMDGKLSLRQLLVLIQNAEKAYSKDDGYVESMIASGGIRNRKNNAKSSS